MKKLFFVFCIGLAFFANAQTNTPNSTGDSVRYYQDKLNTLIRNTNEALRNSADFIAIQQQIEELRSRSSDYSGTVLFTELMHADYGAFNESIAQNGFSPLNSSMIRFGFGASSKRNRWITDYYFFVAGLSTKTKKGEESIKTSLGSFLHFDFGYDLLHSKGIAIYPYAGISLRVSDLSYSKPEELNPGYTNITNLITNNQSASGSSLRLGYQAGLGIDMLLSSNKHTSGGTILFVKAGTNRPVGKDKYKIAGIKYEPGITQGDWLIAAGFKFIRKQ